jgi:hypothetical protein
MHGHAMPHDAQASTAVMLSHGMSHPRRLQATSQEFNSPVTLLDESPIRKEIDNLQQLVINANK